MVRPVLDCLRPPLATLQNGVKVWQEFRGETLPLSALKAVLVCIEVAPSAQLVIVLHIAVVGHGMSDAICADEKPDAILEQESPLRPCSSFCPPVGPRSPSPPLKSFIRQNQPLIYIYIYTHIYIYIKQNPTLHKTKNHPYKDTLENPTQQKSFIRTKHPYEDTFLQKTTPYPQKQDFIKHRHCNVPGPSLGGLPLQND